jgi:Protein of unknown function (DUF2855)
MQVHRLLTAKADPATNRLDAKPLDQPLAPGQVLLAVRRVALTTNNITYALFGEQMRYWQFFPSGQPDWGIVPAWGFADVAETRAEGLDAGERVYGYLPLADHLVVDAARIARHGFVDAAPHRAGLPAIYNRYERCAADPSYRAADENALMVVQPLFTTAFLLADFLLDQAFFGARQVVLSSASSKTAYATAWCLRETKGVELVGLTSNANSAFVQALGCYDRVSGYDDIEAMDATVPTVYADFSGSAEQRTRLHRHFGDAMRHSAVIGATQFSVGSREESLPGAKPTFFFAPEQARSRIESWGPGQFQQRLAESQRRFLEHALDARDPWLRIEEHQGLSAAIGLMQQLAKGRLDPRVGHALQIG